LLVEVQALVTPAAFATPQRTTSGVERNRVQIHAALLERRLGLPLLSHDLFVNVAGGIRVAEPAADLAVVAALISAFQDRPLPQTAVFFGEVGLAGEIRSVSRPEARLAEARELGFTQAYVPASATRHAEAVSGLVLHGVENLSGFLEALWD
jgi:DNA repair protein RadA/Sms